MNIILRRFGSKLIEGFFILLPFLITYLMFGQLFDMLMALTQPVVDVLPAILFSDLWTHRFTALVLLLLIFLIVGLIADTKPAHRVGNWFERTILQRFPPYTILKNLSKWIAGKEVPKQLQPALMTVSPDTKMLVAIIEELPGEELTVFVPLSPTPGLGMLQIVGKSKVKKLECSMTDALGWTLNWGAGTEALFPSRKSSTS